MRTTLNFTFTHEYTKEEAAFFVNLIKEDLKSDSAKEKDEFIKNMPIAALSLSIRARNVMDHLDIYTISDLTRRTVGQIMCVKQSSEGMLDEIVKKLSLLGLELATD